MFHSKIDVVIDSEIKGEAPCTCLSVKILIGKVEISLLVCRPKQGGGFGHRAILAKLGWRVFQGDEGLYYVEKCLTTKVYQRCSSIAFPIL